MVNSRNSYKKSAEDSCKKLPEDSCKNTCEKDKGSHEPPCKKKEKCICQELGGKAILKCKTIPAFDSTLVSIAIPHSHVTLLKISIDPSALCNPSTLVSFSGKVSALANISLGASISLVKINGKSEETLVSHAIPDLKLDALSSTNFAFQYCDCDNLCSNCNCNKSDCITYELRYNQGSLAVGVALSFTNVTLSALAVENITD